MKRRWIIRSFFIGLLLFFVSGWGWSAGHLTEFTYSREVALDDYGSSGGAVYVYWGRNELGPTDFQNIRWEKANFWPSDHWGFVYEQGDGDVPGDWRWHLSIPYWFITGVLSFFTLFVWQKTRPKAKGRAFPVEMGEMYP